MTERISEEEFSNCVNDRDATNERVRLLSRLAVLEVGEIESCQETVIDTATIIYCCTGSAVLLGRVEGRWTKIVPVRRAAIYVRTALGVYRTHFRTISSLLERLPAGFVKVNHGVAINRDRVQYLELGKTQRRLRVGIGVAGSPQERRIDWAWVARRHGAPLRQWFGFPACRRPDGQYAAARHPEPAA